MVNLSDPPVPSVNTGPASSLNGPELWQAFLRHRRLATGIFTGVLASSILAALILPKRYVATASIIVAQQELGVEIDKQISVDKLGDPADLESQVLLVRSPRILRMTLEQKKVRDALMDECLGHEGKSGLLNLFGTSATKCETRLSDREKLWEHVLALYTISGAGRSRVITVSYESQIPAVGQTMANSLTTTYLNDRREGLMSKRQEAIDYLRQQMQQLEDSLHDDQEKIQAFRRKNGLISGASSASIAAERLSSVGQTLSQAEAARAEAAARLSNTMALRNEALEQSPAILASRAVGDLKQQILVNANQIASQSTALGPLHPEMQALERQRVILKRRLETEMASQAASTKESYATASAATANIHKKLDSLKSDVADVSDREVAISAILRDDENKRRQIGELARKIGELEIQKRLISSGTELVNLAELPVTAFFPKPVPFVTGGLIVGLMLAGIAVVMADRRSAARSGHAETGPDPVRNAASGQDFARQIDARIIGVSPFDEVKTPVMPAAPDQTSYEPSVGWKRRFLSKSAPFPAAAQSPAGDVMPVLRTVLHAVQDNPATQEAMASLYATMRLKARFMSCRTIMVTSLRPQEGKTVTALSLARHIAESGHSTLVVESDFARPVLAGLFGAGSRAGLAEVLRGDSASADAVFPADHPRLYIMPAGKSREPAEDLLTSPRMEVFLRWATRFEYVLIDAPACETNENTDSAAPPRLNPQPVLLAPLADAILCCAPADQADARGFGYMLEDLRDADGIVLGVIMTMASTPANRRAGEADLQTGPSARAATAVA